MSITSGTTSSRPFLRPAPHIRNAAQAMSPSAPAIISGTAQLERLYMMRMSPTAYSYSLRLIASVPNSSSSVAVNSSALEKRHRWS